MAIILNNRTKFPIMRFSNMDNQGKEFGVIMLKCAFDILDDGTCVVSPEQEPFNFTDLYHGELNRTSLKMPSDMVSYKPVTDIIINAVAKAPDNTPQPFWQCSFEVSDVQGTFLNKTLQVYGPRHWIPKWKRTLDDKEKANWREHRDLFENWELSQPQAIPHLTLRYEYAYGGEIAKGNDSQGEQIIDAYEYNPIGCGWIDSEWTDHTKPVSAPQIEHPNEPITEPYKQYKPAGYGAIPPAWLPRRPLGGTYDQNWIDNIWPKWPPDYNFRFNNSSSFQAESNRFLGEHVKMTFDNIIMPCNGNTLKFTKPVLYANIKEQNKDSFMCSLNIDTLIVNLAETTRNDCRAFCLWRLVYNMLETEEISINATPDWMDPVDVLPSLEKAPEPKDVSCILQEDL